MKSQYILSAIIISAATTIPANTRCFWSQEDFIDTGYSAYVWAHNYVDSWKRSINAIQGIIDDEADAKRKQQNRFNVTAEAILTELAAQEFVAYLASTGRGLMHKQLSPEERVNMINNVITHVESLKATLDELPRDTAQNRWQARRTYEIWQKNKDKLYQDRLELLRWYNKYC